MIQHITLLANETALDGDGWALIAPFGEHPKTRFVKKNGALQREHFIQVLDHQSADQLLARELPFPPHPPRGGRHPRL